MSQFQEIQLQLQKSKEAYHNLCSEFDKSRRQLDAAQLASFHQLSQQQVSTSNLMNLVNNSSSNSNGTGLTSSGQATITNGSSINTGGLSNSQQQQQTMGLSSTAGILASAPVTGNGTSSQGMLSSTGGGLEVSISVPQSTSSGGATDRLTSLATSITANRVTQLLKLEKKVYIY